MLTFHWLIAKSKLLVKEFCLDELVTKILKFECTSRNSTYKGILLDTTKAADFCTKLNLNKLSFILFIRTEKNHQTIQHWTLNLEPSFDSGGLIDFSKTKLLCFVIQSFFKKSKLHHLHF